MSKDSSLVSIGMPVYNGEKYICQALDSLLAQDYENFELIISDNASTDRTQEICKEYLRKDKRICFHQQWANVGAVKNFNHVFELSSGKYFMWAADHDLWHTTFISRCVSILKEDPNVVLVYSRTMLVDPDGKPLMLTPDQIDTREMKAVNRYIYIIWNLHWCNMVYGLIRREVLGQSGRFRNVWGADHALLAELALRGSFAQIAEPLFLRRKNRPDEEDEARKRRVLYSLDTMNADEKYRTSFEDLFLQLCHKHLQILACAPISFLDKLRGAIATVACFKYRFGAQWRSLSFVERVVSYFIPKKIRRKILLKLQGP